MAKFLNEEGHCSCAHVNQILRKWNTTDSEICKYADENNLIVITKDSDFKNSHFINKTPKKIIRITLGNISNDELITLFAKYLPSILQLSDIEAFYAEIGEDQLFIFN